MWHSSRLGSKRAVGGVTTKLIPRNSVIPTKKSQVFTTYQDQQTTVSNEEITITNKGRFSQHEIDQMVREAEEFSEEDKKVKERIDAHNGMETYACHMKNHINGKIGGSLV
ncbi:hypothetical protein Vadar_008481 [Vaccinium darrowii]|uniref:Uncharacterized protein n=1 Tax=Vaccinium darrowii TaxID=229202 RepID=A0ACB7Y6Y4_9ERIC|nr:hypothetical protein Vadar_008481 [Vaccinium darrowii]